MSNVIVAQEGMSLFTFSLDGPAQIWVQENVQDPIFHGNLLVVETQYAYDLMYGMQQDGLVLANHEGRVFVVEPA